MARSRNIKPSFFDNDELAELDPLARLLFIGFWTIADFKGDFEWREKRVKAKLLPYDKCDIKKLAINLDKSGFIRFYSDGDKFYVNVTNFDEHQNPHKNEKAKGSDIPKYSESMRQVIDLQDLTINRDKTRLNRNNSQSTPADSLILIPDSPILIPDTTESEFNIVWDIYGKKGNRKLSLARFKKMKDADKKLMAVHLPKYVESTPDKQFRKDLQSYINLECWNDEITGANHNDTNQQNGSKFETGADRYERQSRELQEQEAKARRDRQNPTSLQVDGDFIRQ